ncbi:tetraacyldisaccharide 4'-kinase [Rhizobium sp. AC44/96]|uniref:tetraacyldisaccharide 4'-kinase n=1 Tax=unclassified Rhizobium TaxID=2613769 RepID=UPI00080FA8B3|nr:MULTISPECIES: tetraacyldisaccharide 4'-kinase [unclassified Rhizobium]MDM9623787.1 tetraacyldisaccharide 4'-kinase [Rhizobium sp. S96]OCJ17819.1 tetraacyldisaccharide 4'-kinase [Rhizobium sp. AC44/96]
MVSEAPPFWWTKADWRAWTLYPVSFLYGRIAGYRMAHAKRASVPIPVICVGNFTVGGAGKTPTALTIARAAKAKGLKPGFLSRGYGGSLDVTTVVDPAHHRAVAVGDEPLLLAREAMTVISRRRVEGAQRLVKEGADLIIMDDGFQSARLAIDYALLVIDATRGLGNGHIVPGGPVRAPIRQQLSYATALLKVGTGTAADTIVRIAARAAKPYFTAALKVSDGADLAGRRVLAFAGIADPAKFFRTVESVSAEIVVRRSFGDHEHLTDDEIDDILSTADREDLLIVTTSKDFVRLAGHHGKAEQLAARCRVIEVEMAFADHRAPDLIIERALEACRTRRLREKTKS